ncbi:hypothetical protein V462_03845 [Pantoea ananatis 15320]|nr:hypothetical protein V462_03845 [Pantoea ananatis 15320]
MILVEFKKTALLRAVFIGDKKTARQRASAWPSRLPNIVHYPDSLPDAAPQPVSL